ncbi:MAG: ABC transporter ATP-binding protein [Myxococcaceae bacterium]|nr:ABC transporter ATP-binding protein [Myxococcaceae bacterium]
MDTPQPIIQIIDLFKSFGSHEVLSGITLDVPAGSTLVILGGSGSGKTVLMKHMIGLLKPDKGRVIVDGEDIVPLGPEGLERMRRKFGMVFQAAALFDSMTVFENVSFPLREHRKELKEEQIRALVKEKLGIVGLKNVEEKYPADLSGGMRKRVGLARAIVLDPKIVLYDEPTTGLDPITTDYVDEMILDAKKSLGVTSVVISHDIASAFKVADNIAFLYQGHIVDQGHPSKLRHSEHPAVKVFLSTWFGKN